MKFQPGHKLAKGRIPGSKNNPDLNSLRKILEENFHENRPWIKECMTQMLNTLRKQLSELANTLETQNLTPAEAVILARHRSIMLEEFKWLMELKASLEPKQIKADLNITYTAEELLNRFDAANLSPN